MNQPVAISIDDRIAAGAVTSTTNIGPLEWDRYVAEFADAAPEQTQAFRGAVWGDDRVTRLAVFRGGVAIGLALAVRITAGPLPCGIAYVKFGPLWRRKGEPEDREALSLVLQSMIGEFVVRQRLQLKILPCADPRFSEPVATTMNAMGFGCNALPDPNRYLINAALDEDAQRASLNQKWRYNLKKSLAVGCEIGLEPVDAALDTFDALFTEMEQRKNYRNVGWSAFHERLRLGVPEPVCPGIVMVREEGRAVAGAVIAHIGDVAHYLFGATSDRAVAIKAGYAMQWWIINWLRDEGVAWYDLGGEADGNQGLRQFKKGLVGREGAIVPLAGEFVMSRNPLSSLMAGSIDLLRDGRRHLRTPDLRRLLGALRPASTGSA